MSRTAIPEIVTIHRGHHHVLELHQRNGLRQMRGFLFVQCRVVRDMAGHLRLTGPFQGGAETCQAPWPERAARVLASWHTHGGFDVGMWNELPSDRDMRADRMEGVDGWLATPGGRLWHIDGKGMVATLVCGPRCLPSDPDYDPATTGVVGPRYSYWDLVERFGAK